MPALPAMVSSIARKWSRVVGGGDTACEEAHYLSGLCSKVYMIVRKPYLRASEAMKRRVEAAETLKSSMKPTHLDSMETMELRAHMWYIVKAKVTNGSMICP